jgi:hypothetical protein
MVFNISEDGSQHSPAHKLSQQHHGWVKGLAFDPLGRYLASQGRNGIKVCTELLLLTLVCTLFQGKTRWLAVRSLH